MTKGITSAAITKTGNYIVKQKITRRVRLIFYGGAKSPKDNSAFEFAEKNIREDYRKLYPHSNIIFIFVDSAKVIVDTINEQQSGKIDSLDLLFHGTERGLYRYKGASLASDGGFSGEDIKDNDLNASLYAGRIRKWLGDDKCDEARTINDIDFIKFSSEDPVIEIHGCKSGNDTDPLTDSITKNLSEELPNGYVIGHTTKANPGINGDGKTSRQQQDYRHGQRVIWKNGKVIKMINKKGMLTVKDFV
ncbi:hypothetical protein LAN87_001190 [Salmonella enterica]|nr:hypothetical protein [Salmonella enterica]EHX3571191.1 hypothetical protein [Salmonella enterica]EIB6272598.1 hypothetical protein [Salmonella enterica]EIC8060476.1 hypothetical protein [Salmonella enterica]HCM1830233.1 hypothetical protein [Salmonella enterica subsp. salamae serovar 48:z81:z39]